MITVIRDCSCVCGWRACVILKGKNLYIFKLRASISALAMMFVASTKIVFVVSATVLWEVSCVKWGGGCCSS